MDSEDFVYGCRFRFPVQSDDLNAYESEQSSSSQQLGVQGSDLSDQHHHSSGPTSLHDRVYDIMMQKSSQTFQDIRAAFGEHISESEIADAFVCWVDLGVLRFSKSRYHISEQSDSEIDRPAPAKKEATNSVLQFIAKEAEHMRNLGFVGDNDTHIMTLLHNLPDLPNGYSGGAG